MTAELRSAWTGEDARPPMSYSAGQPRRLSLHKLISFGIRAAKRS